MGLKTTIFLLFFSIKLYGQESSEVELRTRINYAFYNDSWNTAHGLITKFLKAYPESNYKFHALFFLAEILYSKHQVDSAMSLYSQVLDFPDTGEIVVGNNKNSSCSRLADINIDKKEFAIALKYINLAEEKHYFRSTCGNAHAWHSIGVVTQYARCYIGLKDYQKTIEVLSPYMFRNDLTSNTSLVKTLYSAYRKIYTREQIKNEFINAPKTLAAFDDGLQINATILMFGNTIDLSTFNLFFTRDATAEQKKKKLIRDIKGSQIYKLAMSS